MILRRDHLVAWRINWTAKSENIRALAAELGFHAGAFIFVDDDPVECAEVEARLSGVLTVQLPAAAHEIPAFLEHVWAFDRLPPTDEDRVRTQQYALQRERERSRAEACSAEEFVRTLAVRVHIASAREADLDRIAQLTCRTTQFNCTLRRRTPAELRHLSHQPDCLILAVRASDRFGDYGLVGAIVGSVAGGTLDLDTFLLSCRALGRKVEHQMLEGVEAAARQRGLSAVRLPFVRGERNQIAKTFLDSRQPDWMPGGDCESPHYVRGWSSEPAGAAGAGVR